MTPSDLDLARLSAAAYEPSPAGQVCDWQDVRAVVTPFPGGVVVATRGTRINSTADILRDAEAWPRRSVQHPQLGLCHAGFLAGAVGLLPLIAQAVAGRPILAATGHSLGAGLAIDLAALLTLARAAPASLVTFEAPRAGGAMLARVLASIPARQYRFGDDPVTEVPWCPGLYEHIREPLVAIGHAMPDPLDCHAIAGVVAWLATQPAT